MTMTKKRLLLIAALPLAIVVTFGVVAMLPPRPGVTKGNFDRIQNGMTLGEAEEIFGSPCIFLVDAQRPELDFRGWSSEGWDGDFAKIYFEKDVVASKEWLPEPILDKIRRWLHLP
jgi:hypothetical protein